MASPTSNHEAAKDLLTLPEEMAFMNVKDEAAANLPTLPGELRNDIYARINYDNGVVTLLCPIPGHTAHEDRTNKQAITAICRTLRSDTLTQFLSSNLFEMTCAWADTDSTEQYTDDGEPLGNGRLNTTWLLGIEQYWDLLRAVKFRPWGWDTWVCFSLFEVPGPAGTNITAKRLRVTSGRPISLRRQKLLNMILDSFYYSCGPSSMPTGWEGRLGDVLDEFSFLLWSVQKDAKPAFLGGPRRELKRVGNWSHEHNGFVQFTHPRAIPPLGPMLIDWVELQLGAEDYIALNETAGYPLVYKTLEDRVEF